MEKNGWIKLNRSILTWRWYQEPNTFKLFVHLLLIANHEDKDYRDITIHRGEVVATQSRLAKETGLSRQNVRTAINHLISTKEITINQPSGITVISIPNYDLYQSSNQESNQSLTNHQPKTNHITRNKEYKELKNIYSEDELKPCGKHLYLSDNQLELLEKELDNEGFIDYIDRVDEWLASNPRPKETHYQLIKKFIKNDEAAL